MSTEILHAPENLNLRVVVRTAAGDVVVPCAPTIENGRSRADLRLVADYLGYRQDVTDLDVHGIIYLKKKGS